MKCIACTVYHRMFCMMTDEWERGLDDRSWPILTYYPGTEVNRVNPSHDGVSRLRFANPTSSECEVGVYLPRFCVSLYASLKEAESESVGG